MCYETVETFCCNQNSFGLSSVGDQKTRSQSECLLFTNILLPTGYKNNSRFYMKCFTNVIQNVDGYKNVLTCNRAHS